MKKTSEVLSRIQDEEALRRQLLESGKIRLAPEKPKSRPRQDENTGSAPQSSAP
jgi:hypothetical protein